MSRMQRICNSNLLRGCDAVVVCCNGFGPAVSDAVVKGISCKYRLWPLKNVKDAEDLHVRPGLVIPCACYARNCSSMPARNSWIISTTLRHRLRVSNLRKLSSGGGRIEATMRESEQEQNAVLVSRRWATILLPMAAAVRSIIFSSSAATATEDAIDRDRENGAGRVELRTLSGCGLGVAGYPDFVYNAEGGGGSGRARQLPDGRTYLQFHPEGLHIPAVTFGTTTIMGLPLPPGLKIEVAAKTLEGYVDKHTGKVELNFLANFYFTAGQLYRAPTLIVGTKLTTESTQGVFRRGKGRRLDSAGNVKLVGVARLAPVEDLFLTTFLTLPTDCLAELSANLSFS